MTKIAGKIGVASLLYPSIEPFNRDMLDTGDGHRIYLEECGNPSGLPVVVFHGGPGGGCSPQMRRYFNPEVYRIILFDQRGCGRSRPHASVENNTTWDLVADIERIREHLDIPRWIVFGGSWGATLALIYAQRYPERALHLVLRGVFLMTRRELDWFYGGGVARFFPEAWEKFAGAIPKAERDDLIAAYHKRLFSGDRQEETHFSLLWSGWENALASIEANGISGFGGSAEYARAFARLENHYFHHGGFLDDSTAILANMARLRNVGGTIVQGRFDMICPPESAWALHNSWPISRLSMIGKAGHALSEPAISAELLRVMDGLWQRYF